MGFAKTLLLGAAFAGIATSSLALDVQFNPGTAYSSQVAGDDFGQDSASFQGATPNAASLNSHGVILNSNLAIERDDHSVTVLLSVNSSLSAAGNMAFVDFSGEFTLNEPAYIRFSGEMDGSSASPGAVNFLYASSNPIDWSEEHFELEYQYGQIPDVIRIDGIAESTSGFVEGQVAEWRLLQPGIYFFAMQTVSSDSAVTADTAFTSAATIGFTLSRSPILSSPEPEPPSLRDLIDLVELYVFDGHIKDSIGKSLLAKIKSEAGPETKPSLKSFVQAVRAQAGKHITSAAAETLLQVAADLE